MKKIYLLLLPFLIVLNSNAQVSWSWMNSLSGSNSQIGPSKIAANPSGGFYITGAFDGTRTFGTYTLTASGTKDSYLARYDNLGNCVWANSYGSQISVTNSKAVAVDANGNIYIAGTFTDTIVVGSTTLNPYGVVDMFVIKVNASGNVIWAKACGGQGVDNATSLAVDGQNNIYLGGTFFFKAYFDGDSIGNNIINENIFITKYSSSGQLQWIVQAGGSQDDGCTGLSVSANRLYVCGTVIGPSCMFGTHSVNAQNADAFIAQYTLAGANQWVKRAGGAQNDYANGVGTDLYGNAYIAGTIFQVATFGPGISLNAGNYDQLYIAKYDSLGNCTWAKKGGNSSLPNIIGGISTDINGYSILTGSFKGTANFSPYNISSYGLEDACIVKYSPSGTCQYALKGGGTGTDYGYSSAWLPSNEYVVTGSYQNTATFGSFTLNTPGGATNATFLGLLNGATAGIADAEAQGSLTVGPNPAGNFINLNFENLIEPKNVVLLNSQGQAVISENISRNQNDLTLDVSKLQSGIYIVKINSKNSYLTKNIQIIK